MLNKQVTIRPAVLNDIQAVCENEKASWLENYPNSEYGVSKEDIKQALEGKNGIREHNKKHRLRKIIERQPTGHGVFVADDNSQIVGSISPCVSAGGRHRLGSFHVQKEYRQQGIGNNLFQCSLSINFDHHVWVHVVAYNEQAIRWYRKKGFIEREYTHITQPAELNRIPIIKMVLPANSWLL